MASHRIVELWSADLMPGWDGLYRSDGSARVVDVGGGARPDWFDLGPAIDLDALLAEDPENVTAIDIYRGADIKIPDGSGYVCCGEGAHGSEGFFARLDAEPSLVWIVAVTDSNPFEEVAIDGSMATFTNTVGNAITVDLDSPDFGS